MAIMHGAIAIIRANSSRVAKATDIDLDVEMMIGVSEPLGEYHAVENFYTGAGQVQLSFTLERQATKSLTQQGLWPKQASNADIAAFAPLNIEIEDTLTGTILHRISSFLPTRCPITYRKGEKSVYRVSGVGIRQTDEAEN